MATVPTATTMPATVKSSATPAPAPATTDNNVRSPIVGVVGIIIGINCARRNHCKRWRIGIRRHHGRGAAGHHDGRSGGRAWLSIGRGGGNLLLIGRAR